MSDTRTVIEPYHPENTIRIVTATSLFDGHDVSINVIRRILQASGAEVIHLGHNRSVKEIVDCAIQEDAHAISVSSYQGGHIEYFKFMHDLLQERGCGDIRIFAGGGGTILPEEVEELQAYGIERIYSPDDGRAMGLQGIIDDMLKRVDRPVGNAVDLAGLDLANASYRDIGRAVSAVENFPKEQCESLKRLQVSETVPVIGITGTGGAGKSTLTDELVRRFLEDMDDLKIAIVSVDPSKRKTGGALLGDRIRMNAIDSERVYMRSMATRTSGAVLSRSIKDVVKVLKASGFDIVIVETSGIGQSGAEIVETSDISMYVMTPEYGAPSQLEKIDMLDYADLIALNKSDRNGADDALRDVKKQYQRNHKLFAQTPETMPVFATTASCYNDSGVNTLFIELIKLVDAKYGTDYVTNATPERKGLNSGSIIPSRRTRYLSELADAIRDYNKKADEEAAGAQKLQALQDAYIELKKCGNADDYADLATLIDKSKKDLSPTTLEILSKWDATLQAFKDDVYSFTVRDRVINIKTHTTSLSGNAIPKIATPRYLGWGDRVRWSYKENFPGSFPFAAGVFPFKREGEDPTRMFAGEGGPERTNRRFHYVSRGMPAKRLSTAFDSVSLYGQDPDERPDIYGKIGNSGVSIACLDDMKKLFSGFNLADSKTSVSLTINGPAPIMTALFMNAAIDQQCEIHIRENGTGKDVEAKINAIYATKELPRPSYNGEMPEDNDGLGLMLLGVTGDQVLPRDVYEEIKADTICRVRGTVQADILKEDQAQNTCIYSVDFALKMMGDVQQYFIDKSVRNFYSVSISGYHMAEAGANPISQLAFTLANGFTYIEYYLSRGMDVNEFAPNFSFFFSNGIDPEFSVIGRVARLIWAKALKGKYGANPRAQKLKYHIQTSGRSLHAQEIDFNDIRTTLQALYAIYDNCNSLHTNAYDEAITTPTEESVRRAMAIQLIINHELGLAKNQNPLQGAFIIEELTGLVEEAVMCEFDRISERGGVIGAMERGYQRSKIQEESLYYETLKHNGELPIMGVNTFLSANGSPTVIPGEVIRATEKEKQQQIAALGNLHRFMDDKAETAVGELKHAALNGDNIFSCLMDTVKTCSIGQITNALYESGGKYRRNM